MTRVVMDADPTLAETAALKPEGLRDFPEIA
jgi:hypothetical protein